MPAVYTHWTECGIVFLTLDAFCQKPERMGGCSSAPAVVDSPRVKSQNQPEVARNSTAPVDTDSDHSSPKQIGGTPRHSRHGYASGASSDSLDGKSSPETRQRADTASSRLGLEDIKSNLIADGDLGTNVVRMESQFGTPIQEIYDGVHDGPVLGSGVSGLVRQVTHKATGVEYAVKCLDVGLIKGDDGLTNLREEIYIMCQVDHPNVVRLEEAYESETEIYLIQQLCKGGDLFDRLDVQPDFHYTEAQCARLVKQMLSALRYLHSKNIVHRDLKLENFLFQTDNPESELKMIDFGLSKHFHFGDVLHEAVGTPYSVAPETILGNYDERCDVWAIGVITFLLLCGDTPFGGACGEDLAEVRENILSGQFVFEPAEAWDQVSDLGKDFVRTLLTIDPKKRPTAKASQRHPWIQTWARKSAKEGSKLNPKVVKAIVSFKELTDMQKLLSEVLSYTLLPEQISGLRMEFEKLDNGDGEITLDEMKKVLVENAESGSLGALTEHEVEEIFKSLRVRKSETTIRWHEFIAGSLSQCKVDDRNLRLAFDRLDTDNKGFITFHDLLDMMGSDGTEEEGTLVDVWNDATQQCGGGLGRRVITYEDFVKIMKGQGDEVVHNESLVDSKSNFQPIIEGEILENDVTPDDGGDGEAMRANYKRSRSRSVGDVSSSRSSGGRKSPVSFLSPGRSGANVHTVINDESQSPLVVHRTIYRAHRELRLAVLEASKRFDENRAKRDSATLLISPGGRPAQADTIMRNKSLDNSAKTSTGEVGYERLQLDDASHRGGRHRTRMVKTVSDMSVLLKSN